MKPIISFIFFLAFGLSLNAQFAESNSKIDQELIKYLETDPYLYLDYRDARNGLKSAKTMGVITLGLIGVDFMFYSAGRNSDSFVEAYSYTGMFMGTVLLTCVTGTVALVKHSNAKTKMKNIEDRARHMIRKSSSLDLKISTNGLGLVYSF